MRAGDLDQFLTIETLVTGTDASGGRTETWTPLVTIPCSVRYNKGREYFSAGQTIAEAELVFRIRYRVGFDEKARIQHGGRYYDITFIAPVQRRVALDLFAKRP